MEQQALTLNCEVEESTFASREFFVRLISLPIEVTKRPLIIEVPQGTRFRTEIKWHLTRPVLVASVPANVNAMVSVQLTAYPIESVPMDKDVCGIHCIGTYFPVLCEMRLYALFMDTDIS